MIKKILILVILFIFTTSLYLYKNYQNAIKGFDNGLKVSISIKHWTSGKNIPKLLKNKGIINKEWPLLLYLKKNNLYSNLQAGDFIIKQGTPLPELVKTLSNAHPIEIPIRILEWYTIEDIDELLTNKKLINKGNFIKCTKECQFPKHNFVYDWKLEWYLFPDTYFVDTNNFTIEHFIRRLLYNFERQFLTQEIKQEYKLQGKTLQDIVIMASIIEKEENNISNMPIISWILWKRIKEGIHMWADATTRYYERNKSWPLLAADFKKDNPYNTRRSYWLPPTAISNPWIKALKASLYPEKSVYYYYLHDNNWIIRYAINNNEHNKNKNKYLR